MPRVCVYTAICGGYDSLKPVPEQDTSCDYICFTDDPAISNPGKWRIIHAPSSVGQHPRMAAKFFRILHHQVFPHGRLAYGRSLFARMFAGPRYDFTIWIDGSIQVKSASFVREFIGHIGASGWSMFVHPDRNCIYPEAELSMTMSKYFSQPIAAQIAAYRAENYPAENGLMATGLIARSITADLRAIDEMWWKENSRWSYQDQLSLPVVLWRLGRNFDPVRKNLWSNEWFDRIPHPAED